MNNDPFFSQNGDVYREAEKERRMSLLFEYEREISILVKDLKEKRDQNKHVLPPELASCSKLFVFVWPFGETRLYKRSAFPLVIFILLPFLTFPQTLRPFLSLTHVGFSLDKATVPPSFSQTLSIYPTYPDTKTTLSHCTVHTTYHDITSRACGSSTSPLHRHCRSATRRRILWKGKSTSSPVSTSPLLPHSSFPI